MHGLKVMTKSISALFHPSFCPILQQKSTPRTHFKAKLSDSNGKLCIFTFSTATCFQNFILMKKRCCCAKTLKSVLICPKCWKVRICLKNPSEMPLKIVFFQILSASYSIYHILRKPRSSEFFISAPISCKICAKTAFWKKLQKDENRLLQQWLQKLPLSAAVIELTKRWTCCYKKLIKFTAASCCWFHKTISLHQSQHSWYNSYHANKCVEVEHGKKSLDYRSIMKIVNQCETTHR